MRRGLVSLILVGLLSTSGHAVMLLDTAPVLVGLFNAYAPTVLGNRMWIGGWLTPADVPDDKIYRSDLVGGVFTSPVLAFQLVGAAVNDPSVVQAPAGTTNLYYTSLDKACAPQPECFLTDNLTGLASSTDGGLTWTDQGIVIPKPSGLGPCGAWAPSAVVSGSEVWLYYHGGNPSFGPCPHPTGTVFRSRFDAGGAQRLDTVVVGVPLPVVNVDVSRRPDGLFVMVGNSTDLARIHRFTSTDGLTWTTAEAPLVDAGQIWMPTPHVTWIDGTHFFLWLGWGQTAGNTSIHEVQRWRWSE